MCCWPTPVSPARQPACSAPSIRPCGRRRSSPTRRWPIWPGRSSRLTLSARLYEGSESRLTLVGAAGPFSSAGIPVDGKLATTLVFSEIPAEVRREQFGELLADPGTGKLRLEAALKGDVYGEISGPARVVLSGMEAGPAGGKLRLEGNAPSTLTIRRLTSSPSSTS